MAALAVPLYQIKGTAKPRIRITPDVVHVSNKPEASASSEVSLRSDAPSAPYNAGSRGRRHRRWNPYVTGPNSTALHSLSLIRARVRDLLRNNAWAAGAPETQVTEVIGRGMRPMSGADDVEFQTFAQKRWADWSEECDAEGLRNFGGLLAHIALQFYSVGEVFIRRRQRRLTDGLTVPLQLQVIEAEQVPCHLTRRLANGNKIIAGVEFDRLGKRVAYHMYRDHPGDVLVANNNTQTIRVPAREVLHVFKQQRPGQVRGMPSMAPILTKLADLSEFEDAELVRKKVAAMMAAFVTTPEAEQPPLDVGGDGGFTDQDSDREVDFEPGQVNYLYPGEDVKFSNPAEVGGSYSPFMAWQLRGIAAGLNMTYGQLTGDLSDANFSSMRVGLLKYRRRAAQDQQHIFAFQICRPVWAWFIAGLYLTGEMPMPGYAERPVVYTRAKFMPDGQEWIDPAKDQKAAKEAVRNGFKTRAQIAQELGNDPDELDAQIAADNARADALGLVLDTDPRKTGGSGQPASVGGAPGPADDTPDDD